MKKFLATCTHSRQMSAPADGHPSKESRATDLAQRHACQGLIANCFSFRFLDSVRSLFWNRSKQRQRRRDKSSSRDIEWAPSPISLSSSSVNLRGQHFFQRESLHLRFLRSLLFNLPGTEANKGNEGFIAEAAGNDPI